MGLAGATGSECGSDLTHDPRGDSVGRPQNAERRRRVCGLVRAAEMVSICRPILPAPVFPHSLSPAVLS